MWKLSQRSLCSVNSAEENAFFNVSGFIVQRVRVHVLVRWVACFGASFCDGKHQVLPNLAATDDKEDLSPHMSSYLLLLSVLFFCLSFISLIGQFHFHFEILQSWLSVPSKCLFLFVCIFCVKVCSYFLHAVSRGLSVSTNWATQATALLGRGPNLQPAAGS